MFGDPEQWILEVESFRHDCHHATSTSTPMRRSPRAMRSFAFRLPWSTLLRCSREHPNRRAVAATPAYVHRCPIVSGAFAFSPVIASPCACHVFVV
jgi:hypothetical protein